MIETICQGSEGRNYLVGANLTVSHHARGLGNGWMSAWVPDFERKQFTCVRCIEVWSYKALLVSVQVFSCKTHCGYPFCRSLVRVQALVVMVQGLVRARLCYGIRGQPAGWARMSVCLRVC